MFLTKRVGYQGRRRHPTDASNRILLSWAPEPLLSHPSQSEPAAQRTLFQCREDSAIVSPGAKLMRTTPMAILVSIIVIAIALVGILGMALRAGDKAPAVGSEAPDFTLNSQDGKPVSLHDYEGKWVVLYFYPKDM